MKGRDWRRKNNLSITMCPRVVAVTLVISFLAAAAGEDVSFSYNGFQSAANLTLDGLAQFSANGLLILTNRTKQETGHAFYSHPIRFKNSSNANASAFPFSTTFVFAIHPQYATLSGHGIAFAVAPTRGLPGSLPSQHLGLFNDSNNGNETNHIFAVELDTILNEELGDINDNHVGIDINGLRSKNSSAAGYFSDKNGEFKNLSLISGKAMQVWVDYKASETLIEVRMSPVNVDKPDKPLLSYRQDLSPILHSTMYVGLSSSTGSVLTSHYVLGWSFRVNGQAQNLALSKLPKLPPIGGKKKSAFLTSGLPVICVVFVLAVVLGVVLAVRRKRKFAEELEDWEVNYGPHRFKYKDLYFATKGFKDKELLGSGGFGRVYRGVLAGSKLEIAVKRISHESRQGLKEFIAEIVSIGRLRHRNVVSLLGYCRRKGELLLVYDYMPNGSLDKYLYDQPKVSLNWAQRFRVLKGVASGLSYLHAEWEQVVVHRDVKASNVLLDGELNGRLGDFGLARLYDHGTDPQTTHVVGTLGYLAPEHTRTGRATTGTDVYAFGAFLLEVACGRRPIEPRAPTEHLVLVDLVFFLWNRGEILQASDPNLGEEYDPEEMELVLKLGLLCSHCEPSARPSMRQVVQFLERTMPLPELKTVGLSADGLSFAHREGFDDFAMSYPSSMDRPYFSHASSVTDSLLSGGR